MADDHSNPPTLGYVRLLGANATVHDMATAAARRCSGIRGDQQDQYDRTVRDIGGAIVDGLPAFYRADDGSLIQLTRDHKDWSKLRAYLAGKTTRTKDKHGWDWVRERHTCHPQKFRINRGWIERAIIQKTDYEKLLISRGEPMPEWWPASIKADRAHSYTDTVEAGSVDLRKHNKRETEARNAEWQERINRLAQESPGKSHSDYCRKLETQIGAGVSFQNIRRITRFPHS